MSSQMPAVLALSAELAAAGGGVPGSPGVPSIGAQVEVTTSQSTPAGHRVWQSADLFGGETVVWIEHQGAQYQLRTTRQGKLILTK